MTNDFCSHAEFGDLISSTDPSSGSWAELRGLVQTAMGGLLCGAGRALRRVMSCFGWEEGFVELCVKANPRGAIWTLREDLAVEAQDPFGYVGYSGKAP